jgi:hypothetical protein
MTSEGLVGGGRSGKSWTISGEQHWMEEAYRVEAEMVFVDD